MKTCAECKEDKSLDEFRCTFDRNRGKSYPRRDCLDCERKAARKRARVRRLTPASKKKRQVERQEIVYVFK